MRASPGAPGATGERPRAGHLDREPTSDPDADTLAKAYLDRWEAEWENALANDTTTGPIFAWLSAVAPGWPDWNTPFTDHTGVGEHHDPAAHPQDTGSAKRPAPSSAASPDRRSDVGRSTPRTVDDRLEAIEGRLDALSRQLDQLGVIIKRS